MQAMDFHARHFPAGSAEERYFDFTRTFRQAFHVYRHLLENRLRHFGTTRAKWSVLSAVVRAGEGQNQNQLARQLGIEGPTLVRLLDDLEKAGLVMRRPNPKDRRAKLIAATDEGCALAEILVVETQQVRRQFIAGMNDAEIAQLTGLLDKLVQSHP